jgi:pimeloyl-ACP methyl ester carboxylesterase
MPVQNLGDVQMHYTAAGDGPQHVIFVHGLRNSGEVWWPTRHRLDPRRVTAWFLDLPGCGNSASPSHWERCTINSYAQDVYRFSQALGIDKVVLIGHSVGAAIATQVALDHPDLVRGLVLVAPASFQGLDYVSEDQFAALSIPARTTSVCSAEWHSTARRMTRHSQGSWP